VETELVMVGEEDPERTLVRRQEFLKVLIQWK
jgi:hypothetical protein